MLNWILVIIGLVFERKQRSQTYTLTKYRFDKERPTGDPNHKIIKLRINPPLNRVH